MNGQRKSEWIGGVERQNDETLARLCDDCRVRIEELFQIVMHAGLRPDQAEIVVQKASLKFLRRQPVFEGDGAAKLRHRWFLKTIRSTAVDVVRYLQRRLAQSLEALSSEPRDRHDEAAAERQEKERRLEWLRQQMAKLRETNPLDYRLMSGRYVEGRRVKELAEREGLSCRAVTIHLSRVRKQFRLRASRLRGDDGDSP